MRLARRECASHGGRVRTRVARTSTRVPWREHRPRRADDDRLPIRSGSCRVGGCGNRVRARESWAWHSSRSRTRGWRAAEARRSRARDVLSGDWGGRGPRRCRHSTLVPASWPGRAWRTLSTLRLRASHARRRRAMPWRQPDSSGARLIERWWLPRTRKENPPARQVRAGRDAAGRLRGLKNRRSRRLPLLSCRQAAPGEGFRSIRQARPFAAHNSAHTRR